MQSYIRNTPYTTGRGHKVETHSTTFVFKDVFGHNTLGVRVFPEGHSTRHKDGRADDHPAEAKRQGETAHVDDGQVLVEFVAVNRQDINPSTLEDYICHESPVVIRGIYGHKISKFSDPEPVSMTLSLLTLILGVLAEAEYIGDEMKTESQWVRFHAFLPKPH